MLPVLQVGTQSEAQIQALRLVLEYRSSSQKKKTMKEVEHMGYRKKEATNSESGSESEESSSEDNSDECSVAEGNDVNSLSCSNITLWVRQIIL